MFSLRGRSDIKIQVLARALRQLFSLCCCNTTFQKTKLDTTLYKTERIQNMIVYYLISYVIKHLYEDSDDVVGVSSDTVSPVTANTRSVVLKNVSPTTQSPTSSYRSPPLMKWISWHPSVVKKQATFKYQTSVLVTTRCQMNQDSNHVFSPLNVSTINFIGSAKQKQSCRLGFKLDAA